MGIAARLFRVSEFQLVPPASGAQLLRWYVWDARQSKVVNWNLPEIAASWLYSAAEAPSGRVRRLYWGDDSPRWWAMIAITERG